MDPQQEVHEVLVGARAPSGYGDLVDWLVDEGFQPQESHGYGMDSCLVVLHAPDGRRVKIRADRGDWWVVIRPAGATEDHEWYSMGALRLAAGEEVPPRHRYERPNKGPRVEDLRALSAWLKGDLPTPMLDVAKEALRSQQRRTGG